MKKYVIDNYDVYAGLLIKRNSEPLICHNREDDHQIEINPTIVTQTKKIYRGIIFKKAIDGKAEDLLYTSPQKYSIHNDDIITGKDEITISDSVNLYALLEYLKFNDKLTQKDLLKIARLVFANYTFLKGHNDIYGTVLEMLASSNQRYKNAAELLYNKLDLFYGKPIEPSKDEPYYRYLIKK